MLYRADTHTVAHSIQSIDTQGPQFIVSPLQMVMVYVFLLFSIIYFFPVLFLSFFFILVLPVARIVPY